MIINREQITKNILLARTIKGFTQEGLASILGHSQQWLQKGEKAEIDLTLDQINRLSEALEVTPQFLLFSTTSQVFNHCLNSHGISGNGSLNNCTANNPELLEKLTSLQKLFESYLKSKSSS